MELSTLYIRLVSAGKKTELSTYKVVNALNEIQFLGTLSECSSFVKKNKYFNL